MLQRQVKWPDSMEKWCPTQRLLGKTGWTVMGRFWSADCSLHSSASYSCCDSTITRLASREVHDFRNPEDPDALSDDSSSFAVTQQQWRACIRRMSRCNLACMLSPSSLDPRLASGAFAVAKDESRPRFVGDRRPLNSRERSIGRAHLPHCPRLRRLISRKSKTVQITDRDV